MKKYYLIRWTSLIGYGDESDERYADEASARAAAYSLLDTRRYEGIKVMAETIDNGESSSSSVAMIQTVKGPYDDEFGGVEYYTPKTGDKKGASPMKKKAIVVKPENIQKIEEALNAVQGRCSARTITAKQIVEAAEMIVSHYAALAGSKKAINGCRFAYDRNNQDFPKAYRYIPESTIVRFEYSSGTMKITSIIRDQTFMASASVHAVLTDTAKSAIAENASHCDL